MKVFFCEYFEVFKNTYFEENLRATAFLTQKAIDRTLWNHLTLQTVNEVLRWN